MFNSAMVMFTGFMIIFGAQFANAGCRPCGDRKACCTEATCQKCDAEREGSNAGLAELKMILASALPSPGKLCYDNCIASGATRSICLGQCGFGNRIPR